MGKKFKPWERHDWRKERTALPPPEPRPKRVVGFRCCDCGRLLPNFTGVRCGEHPDSATEMVME